MFTLLPVLNPLQQKYFKKAKFCLGICLGLLLVIKEGYAVQPPPPPLNLALLRILVAEADLIAVGTITVVKESGKKENTEESEKTVEAVLRIEKLLKGRVSTKTVLIRETYRTYIPQVSASGPGDGSEPQKMVVREIAGPSAYHGRYEKGSRIVILLGKTDGADQYKPLGSGTYDRHLCEFLIEDKRIKTLYFQFADDVGKYTADENQFIGLIHKLTKARSNQRSE
jgi:hypothetical protein